MRKTDERLDQQIAEREAKARTDSDLRQKTIRQLWDLKHGGSNTESYIERKLREQNAKNEKLRSLVKCLEELTQDQTLVDAIDDLRERAGLKDIVPPWPELCSSLKELIELAVLQNQEIEYLIQSHSELERIRRYYPEQLQHLS